MLIVVSETITNKLRMRMAPRMKFLNRKFSSVVREQADENSRSGGSYDRSAGAIATKHDWTRSFETRTPAPDAMRSVEFYFDSANPAGSEVVEECADHGRDAADDPIHDRAHDHGENANRGRKRHVRMGSERDSGEGDQTAEDAGDQAQGGIGNKANFECGSWSNTLEDSHMQTSSDQWPGLLLGRKWREKGYGDRILLDGYLVVAAFPAA